MRNKECRAKPRALRLLIRLLLRKIHLISPAGSGTSGSESPPDSHSIPSVSLHYPQEKACRNSSGKLRRSFRTVYLLRKLNIYLWHSWIARQTPHTANAVYCHASSRYSALYSHITCLSAICERQTLRPLSKEKTTI